MVIDLVRKNNALRCINWPIESGICLKRWLLAKFKMNKLCPYFQPSRIFPEIISGYIQINQRVNYRHDFTV